ncbi:MAG: amidase [Spirochaetae bacterium HGW-Spirochaetae-1]|jgi:amidase|nr:MAG: amidase [Spirochaetae bacterium HGW-Spirochaetae-1]
MGTLKEYASYDGLGLAELVKKKKVSPRELCETAIQAIEKINPLLNAVICPMFDEGRRTVEGNLQPGPFRGVPFLVKDLVSPYAGVPMQNGSKAYKNFIPDYDSELMGRFKKAGLIVLGKTSTPEFGLMGVTEPELFGPTRNPWNRDHTPGGSSGGSAAAVAAGMVPLASGGDGGGSIRIPASCCGLFGMKPTRGRNPSGPAGGEGWQGAVVEHVITRSVRDSAAVLDWTNGSDRGSRCVTPRPEQPYMKEIKTKPGKLKIAFSVDSPIGRSVHPQCVEAVRKAAKLLESLGHIVEETKPDIDGIALARSYFTMYYGEVAADIEKSREALKRNPRKNDFEATTWLLGLLGQKFSARDFVLSLRQWDLAARAMGRFHEKWDLYLTPTMAYPPVRVGELQPKAFDRAAMQVINALKLGGLLKATGMAEEIAMQNLEKTPFTQIANFTGQPAMSVPLHWTPEGLPVGVQFIAPFGGEAVLFRLAAQLEKAVPWFKKRPPL